MCVCVCVDGGESDIQGVPISSPRRASENPQRFQERLVVKGSAPLGGMMMLSWGLSYAGGGMWPWHTDAPYLRLHRYYSCVACVHSAGDTHHNYAESSSKPTNQGMQQASCCFRVLRFSFYFFGGGGLWLRSFNLARGGVVLSSCTQQTHRCIR